MSSKFNNFTVNMGSSLNKVKRRKIHWSCDSSLLRETMPLGSISYRNMENNLCHCYHC
jgi:hypothetical protein